MEEKALTQEELPKLLKLKGIDIYSVTSSSLKEVIHSEINFFLKNNIKPKAGIVVLQHIIDLAKFGQEKFSFHELLFNLAKAQLDYAATYVYQNNEEFAWAWLKWSLDSLNQISSQNPYHSIAQQIIYLIAIAQDQKNTLFIIECSRIIHKYELPKNLVKDASLPLMNSYSQYLHEVTTCQRAIRSYDRYNLHRSLFGPAQYERQLLKMPPKYHGSDFYNQVNNLIEQIAEEKKVINPCKLFHYTSIGNLPFIAKSNGLWGNASLKEQNNAFIRNVMQKTDIKKGDKNVIFSTPGNADKNSFLFNGKLMKGKCRLTFNIEKHENKGYIGEFNQFIKLSDLNVFHHSRIYITDQFSVEIWMKNNPNEIIKITLTLGYYRETVSLTENECLYYGNTKNINRYCLMQLFILLDKLTHNFLKENIFNYLAKQSESELRKIFIIFAQSLTLYAEYNFNGFLSLDVASIEEILILGDTKVKYDFSELTAEEYQKAIDLLGNGKFDKMQNWIKSVKDEETIIERENSCYIFGRLLKNNDVVKINDLRAIPSSLFDSSSPYVETRWGVEHSHSPTNYNLIL